MAIADVLWACPACGTDAALRAAGGKRGATACRACGATFARTPDARIAMTDPASGRTVVRNVAEWTRGLTVPMRATASPAGASAGGGGAPPAIREAGALMRVALGARPLRHRREYLGAIELLGEPIPGTLVLTTDHLAFTGDGTTRTWRLDDLTAVQPSSSTLQIKARREPVVSFRFPADSVRLWEELLTTVLRERYRRAGRGEILEFQPRIVARRDALAPGRPVVGDATPTTADGASVPAPSRAGSAAPGIAATAAPDDRLACVGDGGRRPAHGGRSRPPARAARADAPDAAYRALQWAVSRAWNALGGLTVRGVENIPVEGPFVLVANHLSVLDPILIQAVCPRSLHTMAKSTQFAAPVIGRLMVRLGAFPVRRYQVDPQSARLVLRRLAAGQGVCVYPEGERSWDGRLQSFRLGTIRLLLKAGAPVVPCAIRGSYEAWPRWERRPRFGPVEIRFGQPIRFPRLDDRESRERALPDAIRILSDALRELLGEPSTVAAGSR